MARIRSNRICFTINNYDEKLPALIEDYLDDNELKINYGVIGQEVGDNGTPHLQGFLHLDMDPKKGGIQFWRKEFPGAERAHFEAARGTDEQNKEYCCKEGPFIEVGKPASGADKWQRIVETLTHGTVEDAMKIDYEIGVKYYNQLQAIQGDFNKAKMITSIATLHDWQKEALEALKTQTDRKILFIVDVEGGKGKSALAKHILTSEDNAWACQGTPT